MQTASITGQQQPQAPFRYNTRPKLRPVGYFPFTNGAAVNSIPLPHLGYLARIWVQFKGVINSNGASTFKDLAPFNLVKKFTVSSNEGGVANYDVSGYGTFILNATTMERGYRADRAGAGDTAMHADEYAAGLANGNNNWNLWWCIPINLNMGENRDLGLINLQTRELEMKLDILCEDIANVISSVGTGVSAQSGFNVYYESFEVPYAPEVAQPPFVLIRTLEQSQSIDKTGQLDYEVPHMGALISMLHVIRIDGARSDAVDSFSLVFNDNDNPQKIDRALMRKLARIRYGIELPVGVYSWDFFHSTQFVHDGDTPDLIDTQQIALIQSRLQITDGTVLGSNNNTLLSIRRVMQGARVA